MGRTLIQKEQEASEKYKLLTFISEVTGEKLVRLSPDNVARVEAMIHTDSDYKVANDGDNKESSAYSIIKLKEYFAENRKKPNEYRRLITEIVERLDKENSTHLNSDGVGREDITNRIVSIKKKKLLEYLRDPEGTNFELIDIIAEKTIPTDKVHHGRINLSFASKFCHYMCLQFFDGYREQDNYSIYDSVICRTLPKYVKHYNLKERNLKNYREYIKTIDDVIKSARTDCDGTISRNGFDHLIWYFFKGQPNSPVS